MPGHGGQRKPSILVACEDTGAANALSAFTLYSRARGIDVRVAAAPPATGVFISSGITPDYEYSASGPAPEAFPDSLSPTALLLGTSLSGALERRMLAHARARGVRSVGYVDWWSNFGRRFSSPGTMDMACLPDTVAVMDTEAAKGCKADRVPEDIIQITGNPYWDRLRDMPAESLDSIRRAVRERFGIRQDAALCVLVSSNIRNLGLGLGYDEHDFLKALSPLPERLSDGKPLSWMIKPHPGEPRDELRRMLSEYCISAGVMDGLSGLDAIAAADCMIGMCSSLLFEAAICGRRVISLQPGLDEERLRYLGVFDRIGVPKAVSASAGREAVAMLLNGSLTKPAIERAGFEIGGNASSEALLRLLLG